MGPKPGKRNHKAISPGKEINEIPWHQPEATGLRKSEVAHT